jgi:DNA-binding transcriptional ArsR family regulator
LNFTIYSLSMPGIPISALDEVARRFALLGDPTRLRILGAVHEAGQATVGDIAAVADVSVANASQHLGRLALGGIVGRRRVGRTVVYRIIEPSIEQLCAIVCSSVQAGAAHQIAAG